MPITTVEALLRALDLSHWDRIASAALTAPGVRLDLRSSETGSALGIESRSVAYCIAEWESAATVSRRHLRTFRELFKHGHKTGGAAHVAARTGKRTFGQFSGSAGTSSGGGDQQRSAVSVHLELSVVPGSSSLAARAVLSLPARDGDRSGVVQPQAIDVSGGFSALRDVADAKAVSQWLAACAERAIDNAISALVAPVRGAVGDAEHGPIIHNPSCVTTVEEDAGAVAVSLLRDADLGEAKLAGTAYCQMRVLRFPPGDSQRKCGGCQWLVEDLRLSVAEHAQQDHELRRAYEVFLREVVQRSLAGRRPLVDSQGGLDSLRRVLAVLQPLLHLLAYCATIAGSSEPAAGFLRPVDFVRGGEEGSGDLIVLLAAHSRGAQSEGDGGMSCNRSLAHGYVEVTCRPVEAQQGGSELFIRDVAAAESQEEEDCVEPAEVKLLRVLKGICARNSDTIG